ncbi:MAG: transcription antitermination factor NusB [Betaproteobacteria bacterium]|nr:transcription antitermination factor NusB [Betaproteobacteria bacterium]
MKTAGKTARRRSREIALQALYAWQLGRGDALEHLREIDDDGRTDRALAEALVRGVQSRTSELEALITSCIDREFRRLSPVERAILYIGAFELQQHPETPFKVVINEAIELGKSFGGTGGYKFVNGVLEKLALGLRSQEVARSRLPA